MTKTSSLQFHKMHGAGNDFVLLDMRAQAVPLDATLAAKLADRRLGVGCDQILLVRPPRTEGSLASYEVRNADGSSAGQCGNGARCIGLYLKRNGETGAAPVLLDSPSGSVSLLDCGNDEFEVDMGEPSFDRSRVPIGINSQDGVYCLDSPWGELTFMAASMGNPHALLRVDDVDTARVAEIGPFISTNPVFPEGCNTGFAQVIDRHNVRLRVHERGAGETLACGSGACAAVALLRRTDLVADQVNVFLPGGRLVIKWPGTGNIIKMKGPAVHVFTGMVIHE